jgi:predicted N-formylglutamate amidohydrolase
VAIETAVEQIPGARDCGVILICDHAGNALPPGYGTLGMAPGQLDRHIAYDIGAAAVTRLLAAALDAPAILTRYSRLLIDANRGEDDPTLIMRLSDGAVIPGNATLDAAEMERRITLYYRPYHDAISGAIDASLAAGRTPVILSVHSFTPVWRGAARRWHAGVLWDKDPRFAMPLLSHLEREGDLTAGDNQPYTGSLKNDALYRHGTSRGLAHGLVEIRQDLIADEAGQSAWAERLARIVRAILADEDVAAECAEVRFFGSWADPAPVETTGEMHEHAG